MKTNLSFRTKLLLICGGLSLISLIIGATGLIGLRSVRTEFRNVTEKSLPAIELTGEMIAEARRLRIDLRTLAVAGLEKSDYDKAREGMRTTLKEYEEKSSRLSSLVTTQEEKADDAEIQTVYGQFKKITLDALERTQKGETIHWSEFFKKEAELGGVWRVALLKLQKLEQDNAAQAVKAADAATSSANLFIFLLGIGGVVLAMVVGFLFAQSMGKKLGTITHELESSGTQVNSASEQLTNASQNLASSASESASSLEETVASLEELNSMVKINTDNAKEASVLSQNSRTTAEKGEAEIQNLMNAMSDIAKGSKKIEEIINVIEDIAFQTNLLALNAAVEAARAGEQGKGFAVVAEAVRALAQKSSDAAKEINGMIKESVEKIGHGVKIADSSGEVLKTIVTSVKKVADLNAEIASASVEQSNGLTQISKAMNQLDQATQGNAAAAEEAAASSEEMSAQSKVLENLVDDLSLIITGQSMKKDHRSASVGKGMGPKVKTKIAAPAALQKEKTGHAPVSAVAKENTKPSDVIPMDSPAKEESTGKGVGSTVGF